MKNIIFKKATMKDLELIYNFMLKQAEEERKFMNNLDIKEKKDLFYTKSDVKSIIASRANYLIVAKDGEKYIGCGLAKIEKSSKWNKYQKQGYLGMLYVDKKYRNMGVAKAIQDDRIKWLRSKGIKYLTSVVLSRNIPALKLLTKQGFKPRLTMLYKEIS